MSLSALVRATACAALWRASLRLLLAPVLLLWVPGESYAATADGEAGGYDWKTFGLAVLNFSILIAVLARVAAKPIRDFMYQRSVAIRRELERARSELAAARSEAAELRHRLDQMAHEAAEMLASAQQQAEAEAARACARAEETAERIRADAQRVAAVEVERARRMLREEAVALATGMASELLRERLTEADDARLVDEFIECAGANTH